MPKKTEQLKRPKVTWQFVSVPDAETRIKAAFDMLFSQRDESHADGVASPASEATGEPRGQLPLF